MIMTALIFDVDGTLADTEEAHRRAFNLAFARRQLGWVWDRPLYAKLLEVSGGKERIATYIDSLPLAGAEKKRLHEQVPALHRDKSRIYADLVSGGNLPLRPGVARLINAARAAGVRLAIASTTTRDNIEALLAGTLGEEASAWFSVIACGDEVRKKKPAPDIYLLALSAMGARAENCIAFEDSAHGLNAARAAGLFTVVTPTRWTEGQDFSGAHVVLGELGEICRPREMFPAAMSGVAGEVMAELAQLFDTVARPGAVLAAMGAPC